MDFGKEIINIKIVQNIKAVRSHNWGTQLFLQPKNLSNQ